MTNSSSTFHVTITTADQVPWCTVPGIPDRLIENLCLTKNLHDAEIHAFCILNNHMHLLLSPGPEGLSSFVQSFKTNSLKDVRYFFESDITRFAWQSGFRDECIRDTEQHAMCQHYIECNALNHGFVREADQWPWTSLHFEHLVDRSYL